MIIYSLMSVSAPSMCCVDIDVYHCDFIVMSVPFVLCAIMMTIYLFILVFGYNLFINIEVK